MSQLESVMTSDPLPPSRHRRTWGRRIAALVSIGLVLAMVAAAYVLLRGGGDANDFSGSGTDSAVVIVSRGDTLTEIGQKLEEADVVMTAGAFIDAAQADERAASIGPGKYTLRKEMSAAAALELMLDPQSRADSRLVLPEGLRLEQTVAAASDASSLPKSNFQEVLQDPAQLGLAVLGEGPARGLHVPGELRPHR